MIKKSLKYLLAILLVIALLFSFSVAFADEEKTDEEVSTTATESVETIGAEENSTEEQEVHNDDLYIIDSNVVMDKLVDGNVYIMGNDVKITGKVNGSLFVLANTLSFDQDCEIGNSVFACANSIYFDGACYDLYAIGSKKLEMTYNSYIFRDLRAVSSNFILKSAIGRNTNIVATDKLDLGPSDDDTVNQLGYKDIPAFYGNFNYMAKSEVNVPEESLMTDDTKVNFTPITATSEENSNNVSDVIMGFVICAITNVALALLIKYALPNVNKRIENFNYSSLHLLTCFGIGLLILFCSIVAAIILIFSSVGVKLSILLILALIIVYMVSIPFFVVSITDILKEKLKIDKTILYYLLIALVSCVLHGISLIPVLGGFVVFVLVPTVVGLYFFKNGSKKVAEKTEE